MPKTFATHKSTYLYLATTRFYRIFQLNDVSMVRFGDIGSAEINHLRSRPRWRVFNNDFCVPPYQQPSVATQFLGAPRTQPFLCMAVRVV